MSLNDICIQRCFTLIAPIRPEGLPSLSCILTACNCPNTGILVMGGYPRQLAQKACQIIIGCSINRHQRRREGETLPWLQPPLNWPQCNGIVIYIMLLAHRYRTLEFEELKSFPRNRLIMYMCSENRKCNWCKYRNARITNIVQKKQIHIFQQNIV